MLKTIFVLLKNFSIAQIHMNTITQNTYFLGLNMFFIPINIQTFRFSSSKIFLQLLILQKISIFTFGSSHKVNSYV